MEFHSNRSKIKHRAVKNHRDPQAGWNFMAGCQKSETELRKSTGTHTLGGI
jgi:hypothetical protein